MLLSVYTPIGPIKRTVSGSVEKNAFFAQMGKEHLQISKRMVY